MKNLTLLTLVSFLLAACTTAVPSSDSNELLSPPTVIATTTSSPSPIRPATASHTPTAIPLPTNTYTVAPEPDIAPNCKIANEKGQFYLLSDKEFSDLGTTESELDRALVTHYQEWANYRQMVPWSTQPVKLGEVIVSGSLDEYLRQINPAVTLVVVGESVDWQLPSNMDFFVRAQEISQVLQQQFDDFDGVNPQNESLRSQYPEVENSATYALYAYFDHNLDRLQSWCNTYQQLFGTSP
jgi:hypothetical protein